MIKDQESKKNIPTTNTKNSIQSNETSRYFKDTLEESVKQQSNDSHNILIDNLWGTNGSSHNGWSNNFFDPEEHNTTNTNNGTDNNSYNIHNLWNSKTLFGTDYSLYRNTTTPNYTAMSDLNEVVNDNSNPPKKKTMAEVIASAKGEKIQKNIKPVNDTNKNNIKPPTETVKKPVTNGEIQPSNVPYSTTNKDQLLKE